MEDVIVVGGGPAGLYSTFYCGLRGLSVKLIEGQSFLGGKLNVYKDKNVWDIGGVVAQPAKNIIESLVTQSKTFDPVFVLGKSVNNIRKEETFFCVETNDGDKHYAKKVILGTGTGISVPTKLDVDYSTEYELTNLNYDILSTQKYRGKKVVISGSNAKSIKWAKEVAEVAETVCFIYRKDLQKGSSVDIESLLNYENITCLYDKKITKVVSNDNKLIHLLEMTSLLDDSKDFIEVDSLLVSHGVKKSNPLIQGDLEFNLEKNTYFNINEQGETSVEGIFAAGDAAYYDGKLRMIAESFHDAITASNAVKKKLDPNAADRGKVSSHHEELKKKLAPK